MKNKQVVCTVNVPPIKMHLPVMVDKSRLLWLVYEVLLKYINDQRYGVENKIYVENYIIEEISSVLEDGDYDLLWDVVDFIVRQVYDLVNTGSFRYLSDCQYNLLSVYYDISPRGGAKFYMLYQIC